MGAAQQMLVAYGAAAGAGATWNPADKSAEITLSGGDLIATRTTTVVADYVNARATAALTGKKYWEVEITDGGQYFILGVMDSAGGLSTYIGADVHGWGYANGDGALYHNGSQIIAPGTLPAPHTAGTVFGFAYNASDTKFYLSVNGVWVNSSDPATNVGALCTTAASGLFPATGVYTLDANKRMSARFSSGFTYTPPSGYSGL